MHVEKFFARNLGGLIHTRTRVPGRLGKATSRTPSMYVDEKSDEAIVCAGQRMSQEGSSPSGARMRSAVFKSGGNASLAGERRMTFLCSTPEGRVSIVRWNPKGLRRSTGS